MWRNLIVLCLAAVCTGSAHAGNAKLTEVSVQVLDTKGEPIATAYVRNPQERELHEVNSVTGRWSSAHLYLPGGKTEPIEVGAPLTFDITAPGYISEKVRYVVRKRKNDIIVTLAEMDLEEEEDDLRMPIIAFGRDVPLDGVPAE